MTNKTPVEIAEAQLDEQRKNVDYDTREFTIEILVKKYQEREELDDNEIYVPEYQREFVWNDYQQSRFIESVLLGLPLPLIFVAEIPSSGKLEIVDGSQRIRTLSAFLSDKLELKGLKTLTDINGFRFSDLHLSRQRKFKNTPMRMIVLSSKATEDVRNDVFDRINTSSVPLLPMETRKGIYPGTFNDFIFKCASDTTFKQLCPLDKHFQNRQEEAELTLRFFAFLETFPNFKIESVDLASTGVARFLDYYMDFKNKNITKEEIKKKEEDFLSLVAFVKKNFHHGFAKTNISNATSRPYFEAISVGSILALKESPNLIVNSVNWTRNIPEQRYHTHKPNFLKERINFVKRQLLGQ